MNTYLRFNSQSIVDGTPFIHKLYDIVHSGSCQCFKDCNCGDKKGLIIGQLSKFRHPLSVKQFDTVESCAKSYYAIFNNCTA